MPEICFLFANCCFLKSVIHITSILFELYGHMYCYYNVIPEANFVACKQHCLQISRTRLVRLRKSIQKGGGEGRGERGRGI